MMNPLKQPPKKMTICHSSIIGLLLFFSQVLIAQDVIALRMMFDHDPTQWEVLAETEEDDGRLETFDQIDGRKMFWNYELYSAAGRIWNLFPGQYDNWRLQGDTISISMQTVFQGRWPEWRLSDGDITLTLRAAHLSNPFYWTMDHPTHGKWEMYSYYEQDARDWEIIDELSETVPVEMKIAACFIVMAVNFILL